MYKNKTTIHALEIFPLKLVLFFYQKASKI